MFSAVLHFSYIKPSLQTHDYLSSQICIASVPSMTTDPDMEGDAKATETEQLSHIIKTALSCSVGVDDGMNPFTRTSPIAPGAAKGLFFRTIGLGSCGTVFELPGTTMACKKGTLSVWTDFCLTNTMYKSLSGIRSEIQQIFPEAVIPRTPRCHSYHPIENNAFWSTALKRFPSEHQTRQSLFTVDRIHPLPLEIRESLIAMYFDPDNDVQQGALQDLDNGDCLVRVYLGERETARQKSEVYDTLRNFPLRLNMMEDLDLDIFGLATEMAIGLAIMHWQARIDGMDVEFVLGKSTAYESRPSDAYSDDSITPHTILPVVFKSRAVHLWILDFDKATRIDLTKHHVSTQLVPSFLGNDPYFPMPQIDEELWYVFCEAYLRASHIIMVNANASQTVQRLPQFFLDDVLKVLKENEDWNEQDNIVFA